MNQQRSATPVPAVNGMPYVRISRSEYFLYMKILVAVAIIPFLLNAFSIFYKYISGQLVLQSTFLTYLGGAAGGLRVIVNAVATAWILNRSEKRKGSQDRFWMWLGILFGPIAFVGYVTWGLCKYFGLTLEKSEAVSTADGTPSSSNRSEI